MTFQANTCFLHFSSLHGACRGGFREELQRLAAPAQWILAPLCRGLMDASFHLHSPSLSARGLLLHRRCYMWPSRQQRRPSDTKRRPFRPRRRPSKQIRRLPPPASRGALLAQKGAFSPMTVPSKNGSPGQNGAPRTCSPSPMKFLDPPLAWCTWDVLATIHNEHRTILA